MTTSNKENYGEDKRNFTHTEDDIRLEAEKKHNDLYGNNQSKNESYVDEYQKNIDNEVANDDQEHLDHEYSDAIERDDDEDLDENDLDDDLIEDYDENDREIDNFYPNNSKQDEVDQEFDIDQDLEEKDPVNHPREF